MDPKILVDKALLARKHSHSPYSGFRVGAALLAADGSIYTGSNIENSSFSLTLCAERVAISKAVSEGQKKFKALAVAADGPRIVSPCGACRQVISELAANVDIILANGKGKFKIMKAHDLLPMPFTGNFFRNK